MGGDQSPEIPRQVLDSPLNPIWLDDSFTDELRLMGRPAHPSLEDHDTVRDEVFALMNKLAGVNENEKPNRRTYWTHFLEKKFQGLPYTADPYVANPEHAEEREEHCLPPMGKVDYAFSARAPKSINAVKDFILVIEVKPAGANPATTGVTNAMAREVDLQIRTRANGAQANGVNKHFYLIGWVGFCFRPYYWCQGEGHVTAGIHPSRRPGVMRPNDCDLMLSTSYVSGPNPLLWRDVRIPDNQRVLQQVIKDALRACDGFGPEYADMYGPPCQTVSLMGKEASTDASPESAMSSASSYQPRRLVEVVPSSRRLRSVTEDGQD